MLSQALQQLQPASTAPAQSQCLGARVERPNNTQQALWLLEEHHDATVVLSTTPSIALREHLYSMADIRPKAPIIDLGTLPHDPSSLPALVEQLVGGLCQQKHTVLLLSAAQNLSTAVLQGLKSRANNLSLCAISPGMGLSADTYEGLENDALENQLHDFCLMAHQSYYTSQQLLQTLRDKHFDLMRLGQIRTDHRAAEPTFRGSDAVSFDLHAVRAADCPCHSLPNGLHAEEACQLAHYAGCADRVAAVVIHGLSPTPPDQAHNLAAQIAWHIIEGIALRRHEHPATAPASFKKFIVSIPMASDLIFYRSNIAATWWMELHPAHLAEPVLIPCSQADYAQACQQEIPERWLRNFSRLQQNISLPEQPNAK